MSYRGLYLLTLIMLCIGASYQLNAQTETEEPLEVISDEPLINVVADRYKPRPKFVEFNVETFDGFWVDATSDIAGNEGAQVSQNLIREAKVRFPVVLKEKTNVIGGLGYTHEQFKFSDQTDVNYPLFVRFDDRSLTRISFSLFLKRDLDNEKFMFTYFNSSLNSDVKGFQHLGDQLKISISTIFGKNRNPHKQIGYGASFGYDFGQPTIFPLFVLNNDFSAHWGYELLLPKSVQLRYSPNEANHLFATLEVKGASYNLQDSLLSGFDNLEFRRSSVRLSQTYEREIYDWLWVGGSIGYRVPINIFISEPRENRRDAIFEVDANSAFYFDFSVFIVPPRKLYNRAKSSG